MKKLSLEIKIIQLVMKQMISQQYSEEINPLVALRIDAEDGGSLSAAECINRILLSGAVDWMKVRDLLSYHELGAVFYAMLRNDIHLLPQEMVKLLTDTFYWTLKDNLDKLKQFQLINQAFEQDGLRVLALKGSALLVQLYAQFPIRPMADIDILLREEDYEKGSRILDAGGYKKELLGFKESYWRRRQCHLTFIKKREGRAGTILEAHWSMDFRRNGRLILEESWQKTRDIDAEFGRVGVLSPEDTLLSLALHQRRFGKEFCLKYILDIALLLKKYGKEFDWDYFLSVCGKYGLSSCAVFLLFQGKIFLDSGLFDYGLARISLPKSKRAIMEKFIVNSLVSLDIGDKIKENYLKSHFLVYDTYREPVKYIINIPLEQFAKFYGLKPYTSKTKWFYWWRFIYGPFRGLVSFLSGGCLFNSGAQFSTLPRCKARPKLTEENEAGPGGLRVIRAWGWSMYPNIKDGDLVILKKKKPLRGEVVCFSDKVKANILHRLVRLNGEYLITRGDSCSGLDQAIKKEDIFGVAIAVKRGKRIIPIKGRWLYGYFYFLSGLIISSRNLLKRIIINLQDIGVYPRIARVIFSGQGIEIIREAETSDFCLIKARINGREAGALKIDKKTCSVVYLYVRIHYRKLGLEAKLKEESLKL